jgi:hypothetical protein
MGLMAELRSCDYCGTVFTPRREHARFCSARCRAAWNREQPGTRQVAGSALEGSALEWSVAAMTDTGRRLLKLRTADPRAFAMLAEMVWRVTIVDATLVRHHPEEYDGTLAAQDPAERQLVVGTMAGLRFVRNQMHDDIDLAHFTGCGESGRGHDVLLTAAWTWTAVPEPDLESLSPRGQEWELDRYRAYHDYLAGHQVGEIFGRATAFLRLAAARSSSAA